MESINIIELVSKISEKAPQDKVQEYTDICKLILKKTGEIRATKPKIDKNNHVTGKAAFVWRNVVFLVSKVRAHQCMPVCSDFDLPAYDENGKWSCAIARDMSKELDFLIRLIVDLVPVHQCHGLMRWGRALGYV